MRLTVGQRLWLGLGAMVVVMVAAYLYVLNTGRLSKEPLTGAATTTEARRASIVAMQDGLEAMWQSVQAHGTQADRLAAAQALTKAEAQFARAVEDYRATASNADTQALADEISQRARSFKQQLDEVFKAVELRRERRAALERYLAEGRALAAGPPSSAPAGSIGRTQRRAAAARDVARQVQERLREVSSRGIDAAMRGFPRTQFLPALARYEVFADTRPQRDWLERVRRWIGEGDRYAAAAAAVELAPQRALNEAQKQYAAVKTYIASSIGSTAGVDLKAAMERYTASVTRRQEQIERVLLGVLIAIALIGALTIFFARRPLRRLAASTRPYVASDLSFQTLSMRNDEAGELAAAVRSLIERLEPSRASMKRADGEAEPTAQPGAEEVGRIGFYHARAPMLVADPQGRVVLMNAALIEASGYALEEIKGMPSSVLWSLEHTDAERIDATWAAIEREGQWQGQIWIRHRDGQVRAMSAAAIAVREEDRIAYVVMTLNDQSAGQSRSAIEEEQVKGGLDEQLAHALARTRRQGTSAALLCIDVDQFKGVDQILGAEDSGQLMQAATNRLYASLRVQDVVARTAEDEFIVLLQDVREPDQVRRVAEKILNEFSAPVELSAGLELPVRAHIGIAMAPADANDAGMLKRNAAAAASRARETRGASYAFFAPDVNEQMQQRRVIEISLCGPDLFSQLMLHYQPRVYVDGERLVAAQVALRWQHPDHGLLRPERFLPLASADTAAAIEDWVVREACKQVLAWRQSSLAPVPVAIRMQRQLLAPEHLIELIESALAETRVDARMLELEWDVASLPQSDEIAGTFERLARLGVNLSLDVDAADRTALSRARRLPLTHVKLGRSLVESIRANPLDQAMARATITLARSLGTEIVVDGVETEAQAGFLRAEGCLVLQGPLYGSPMPADALQVHMTQSARGARAKVSHPS